MHRIVNKLPAESGKFCALVDSSFTIFSFIIWRNAQRQPKKNYLSYYILYTLVNNK